MKDGIWWFLLFPFFGPLLAYFLILLSQVGWKIGELAKRLKKDPSGESIEVSGGDALSFLAHPVKLIIPWWLLILLLCILVEWHWLAKLIFAPIVAYLLFRQVRPWLSRIPKDQEGKGKFGRDAIKTLIFFAVATLAFLIFMSIRFPGVDLSPGNFFSAEWLKMNLLSLLAWYAVVFLGMSALFFHRIFWKGLRKSVVLIILLAILGLNFAFVIEGTSRSIPFFTDIPGDSLLYGLMAKTEPVVVPPFIPKNMNDYKELFQADEYDVIAVNWEGYFRFDWVDHLGKKIDQGTVFNGQYADKMRDPKAHGRSPVVGAKDSKLKRISSFRGEGNGQLSRTFFLMVTRKGGGDLVIFPHNAPKEWPYYGDRAEGFFSTITIRVWHFPAEIFKQQKASR